MGVPTNAMKRLLQEVIKESDAGRLANATIIAKDIFGEEAWRQSLLNVIDECNSLGLLSRVDLDLSGIDVSAAGRIFAKN